MVGIYHGALEIDPTILVEREISLAGCHAFTDELPKALALLPRLSSAIESFLDLSPASPMCRPPMNGSSRGRAPGRRHNPLWLTSVDCLAEPAARVLLYCQATGRTGCRAWRTIPPPRAQLFRAHPEFEVPGITLDFISKNFVLRPIVETRPKAKRSDRDTFSCTAIGGVDGRRPLVLDHVARQEEVAAV